MEFIPGRESDSRNAQTCEVHYDFRGKHDGFWNQRSKVDGSMYIRILDVSSLQLLYHKCSSIHCRCLCDMQALTRIV